MFTMRSYQLFIGIDISKKWIDVSLTSDGQKAQMFYHRFDNTLKGFKAMLKFIKKSFKDLKDSTQWLFCMEHTGIYTLPLCKFLQANELFFHLASGHHLSKSMGLRRGKSDKTDSADIARYAFLFSDELTHSKIPSDKLLKIKALLSLRGQLVKNNTALKSRIKELKFAKDSNCFGTAISLSKTSLKANSNTIKELEKQVAEVIKSEEELSRLYSLLVSVKGVGLIIAAHLLVYTVGFTAFKTSRQFACYTGFAPFAQTSGTSIAKPARVSHMANKKLKGLISNGASTAIMYDKELQVYYQRRIAKGHNKYKVKNAICNKFLHRIFAVINRGTPYVELNLHRA